MWPLSRGGGGGGGGGGHLCGFPFMWVVSCTEMCRLLSVCTERKDGLGGECFRTSGPPTSH